MASFTIDIMDRPDRHFAVRVTPPPETSVIIGVEPPSHTYLNAIRAYIAIFAERMKALNAPPAIKKNSISIFLADKDHGKCGVRFSPTAQELLAMRSKLGEQSPHSLLLACDLVTVILETSKLIREQSVIITDDEVHEMGGAIGTVKDIMTGVKRH